MCGIWGSLTYITKVGYSKSENENENGSGNAYNEQPKQDGLDNLQKYAHSIKHRGPDETNVYNLSINNIFINLIFHRLAIVDIQNGHQPFVYQFDKRKILLVANGEIYNYKNLIEKFSLDTNSDCEVILKLYLKIGIEETVFLLDGEFAFVLIDITEVENDRQIINAYFVRDRFGIRPLFIGKDLLTKKIYFSSELKGIPLNIHAEHVKPRKICILTINDNRFEYKEDEYYTLITNRPFIESGPEFNEGDSEFIYSMIRDSLIESVRNRMYSERPLGCLLSGGLDSSLIAGIASKILGERNEKLNTFSIGMSTNSPDVVYARKVADFIGSNHTEVIIPENEWLDALPKIIYQIETYDTTTIRASTGQYLLAKWISENTEIKVLLNGDGSDELTSGYLYFYNAPNANQSHIENIRLLNNIHYYDVLRVDRGISAHGLEARVPFLCHHFVETYLSIDPKLRNPIKNSRIEKYLLRKSFESLNIIPNEVLWRKKEAFSDGVSLKEKSWYQIIEDSIIEDESSDSLTTHFLGKVVPQTKESRYFRRIFDFHYPKRYNILETNEYWLPKWSGEVINPSARVLSVYE